MNVRSDMTGSTVSKWEELFDSLPGGDLIRRGLTDLHHGKRTESSLLVQIGGPRLRSLGMDVPQVFDDPEHHLYSLLAQVDSDSAHSRYNALIRTLVSFERAAGCVNR